MKLKDKIQLVDRQLLLDDRGWFLKVMKGDEDFLQQSFGEIYVTLAKPMEWRANHFHTEASEWFTVLQGQAKVILEDIESKERLEIALASTDPKTLFVPPHVAHVFLNDSKQNNMLLITYADRRYVPNDTTLYNLLD